MSVLDWVDPMTAILLASALCVAIVSLAAERLARLRERIACQDRAQWFLEKQFAAVGRLADDPATPPMVAELAATLVVSFGRSDIAEYILRDFERRGPESRHDITPEVESYLDALDSLASHREDLLKDFIIALIAGRAAMELRWASADEARSHAARREFEFRERLQFVEENKHFRVKNDYKVVDDMKHVIGVIKSKRASGVSLVAAHVC